MQTASPIPLDVIETIVDKLPISSLGRREAKDLRACALVSHAFLAPARRRIFFEIRMTSGRRCTELWSIIQENPDIVIYPRSLYIRNKLSDPADGSVLEQHMNLISIISALLPGLEKVTLDFKDSRIKSFDFIPVDLQISLLELFRSPNLVSLEISGIHSLPFSELARGHQFKQLVSSPEDKPYPHHLGSVLVVLGLKREVDAELQCFQSYCGPCTELVTQTFDVSSLKKLSVGQYVPLDTFWKLLSESQQSLEDLEWACPHRSYGSFGTSMIHLPNLRSLSVSIWDHSPRHLELLSSLLEGGDVTASGALRIVTLKIHIHRDFSTMIADSSWRLLAVTMTHPKYSNVKDVIVKMSSYREMPAKEAFNPFWEQVSSLRDSGVLRVIWNDKKTYGVNAQAIYP